MSTNLVRMKFAAVAAKIEVTPGVDSIGGTLPQPIGLPRRWRCSSTPPSSNCPN